MLPLSGEFSFQPETWGWSREQGSVRLSLKIRRGGTLASISERREGRSQPKEILSLLYLGIPRGERGFLIPLRIMNVAPFP